MKAPCKECQVRYLGCHDHCTQFSEWKAERQLAKTNKDKELTLNSAFASVWSRRTESGFKKYKRGYRT